MAYNEELADRVRVTLAGREGITEKKMFGGMGFMLHGNMCCGVTNDDLMVRVGADAYDDSLAEPHARLMDFTGRPMKGFVFVSSEGTKDDESLEHWVGCGASFAESLPRK